MVEDRTGDTSVTWCNNYRYADVGIISVAFWFLQQATRRGFHWYTPLMLANVGRIAEDTIHVLREDSPDKLTPGEVVKTELGPKPWRSIPKRTTS